MPEPENDSDRRQSYVELESPLLRDGSVKKNGLIVLLLFLKRLLENSSRRQYFLTSSSFLFFGYGGTLGVTSNTTVGGTLDVTGATGIDGDFDVHHYFRIYLIFYVGIFRLL